jgi:hypothetical protein
MTYKNRAFAVLTAAVMVLLVVVACDNSTEPEDSPFVGTWNLSEMHQSIFIQSLEDVSTISADDTIIDTTLTWDDLSNLGVSAVITFKADSTFNLNAEYPALVDTLGNDLGLQSLSGVQGNWSVDSQLDSIKLNILLTEFNIGGALSLDDPDSPSLMTINNTMIDTHEVDIPVDDTQYISLLAYDSTVTEIAFTKQ